MSKKIIEHNGKRIFLDTSKDKRVITLYWGGLGYPTEIYRYQRNGRDFFYKCHFSSWDTPEKITLEEIQHDIDRWHVERIRRGSFPRFMDRIKSSIEEIGLKVPKDFGVI